MQYQVGWWVAPCSHPAVPNTLYPQFNPRLSILRGVAKSYAVINTRAFYGLHNGCTPLIQELLRKKQYIYPLTPNVRPSSSFLYNTHWTLPKGEGYLRERPFEHNAIIGTLHDDLFGGNYSITKQYSLHFREGMEATFALKPSMVALAATAVSCLNIAFMILTSIQVYAALKEWDTGARRAAPFMANVFQDPYMNHIKDLKHIEESNKPAYDSMMRRLFRLAA